MQLGLFKRAAIGATLAAAAALSAPGAAQAGVVSLDISGISSNEELGNALNETRSIYLGWNTQITSLSWDVWLTADAPSWLSEISVDLNNGEGAGVQLSPDFANNSSGTNHLVGSFDLLATGNDFFLGASGRLNFEFFEQFNDFAQTADGRWERGSLTIGYVPEPAGYALVGLALLGAGIGSRRRKS